MEPLCAQDYNPGLHFTGIIDPTYQLDLTPEEDLDLPSSFALSFDISIWNPGKFGHVFRIQSNSITVVSMLFDCVTSTDTAYFVLTDNSSSSRLRLPIARNLLGRGRWQQIDMAFNTSSGNVACTLSNGNAEIASGSLLLKHTAPHVRVVFGHFEDPDMVIRSIAFSEFLSDSSRKLLHFWPLNESEGSIALDAVEGGKATQQGLVWLSPLHRQWTLERTFAHKTYDVKEDGLSLKCLTRLVYDQSKNEIFIIRDGSFGTYSLVSDQYVEEQTKPSWVHEVFLNDEKSVFYRYQGGGGPFSRFDSRKKEWEPLAMLDKDTLEYYLAPLFMNPLTGQIMRFGGYGKYTFKNDLSFYDPVLDSWQSVETKEETIEPRAFSAVCQVDSVSIYIIGGGGTVSGKQIDGAREFLDLWKVNLRDYSFHRLWKQETENEPSQVWAVIPSRDSALYILRGDNSSERSITLSRLSLTTWDFRPIAEPFVNPGTIYGFWFDRQNSQFMLAMSKTDSTLALYTLSYPVLPMKVSAGEGEPAWYYFVGLVLLLGLVYYFRRSSVWKKQTTAGGLEAAPRVSKAHVQLFGGFSILGDSGVDYASAFAPQTKELFQVLVLHTNPKKNSGIRSERLNLLLWPDAGPKESKNRRGVAIKKLRDVLAPMDGLHIIQIDHMMVVECEKSVLCEYFEYLNLGENLNHSVKLENEKEFLRYLAIVEKGSLLPDDSYKWLDALQSSIHESVLRTLEKWSGFYSPASDCEMRIRIANTILKWDSLNEKAWGMKLDCLAKLGRHGEVQSAFKAFTDEYFIVFEKEYPLSIRDLRHF